MFLIYELVDNDKLLLGEFETKEEAEIGMLDWTEKEMVVFECEQRTYRIVKRVEIDAT